MLRSHMFARAWNTTFVFHCEFWIQPRGRASASNVQVPQQPAMAHAHADVTALEHPLHRIRLFPRSRRLHIIPRLRLATIFASILSSVIRRKLRVEEQNVHRGRAESHELQVVRHHPLVVRWITATERNTIGFFVVLLVLLARPREEEATRGAVLQAVRRCAGMQIQLGLLRAEQKRPEQACPFSGNWAQKLRVYARRIRCAIDCVNFSICWLE